MKISYKFSPKEIQKLSKFKNPSVVLRKENIVKNGKYKIYLTKNMFNKLLSENQLKYTFNDMRKQYYIQNGGSLASIFKRLSPNLIKFGKKLLGGPTPFLAMKKCVFSHFSPWGKMGKKYMERRVKVFISLSFHILFSPFFPMGKNGKTHIFPWAKMGLDPPSFCQHWVLQQLLH